MFLHRTCNLSLRRSISHAAAAKAFADAKSAQFIAAAGSPSSIPELHGLPEIIVTGRSNVGKSSLLNAVVGRTNLLNTSKKPGRTQTLNFFRVGTEPGSLVLVDAPGYGSRGRPEWGELFDYYVQNRTQLKRVYILFNAKHGLNEIDRMMLQSLDEQIQSSKGNRFTLQAILTKVDTLESDSVAMVKKTQKEIFQTAPTCLPALLTSSTRRPPFGIDEVRRNIAEACGLRLR